MFVWFSKFCLLVIFSCGHANLLEALSVRRSVCWSIGPSAHWSVCGHESKSGKTSVLEAVCVGRGVGCGWGLAIPAYPSATILWPRVTCYFATTPVGNALNGRLKDHTIERALRDMRGHPGVLVFSKPSQYRLNVFHKSNGRLFTWDGSRVCGVCPLLGY